MTEKSETSFIDKLQNGDEEGFKADAKAYVVDAVAKQVSNVGDDDISFNKSDDSTDTSGKDNDSNESGTDGQEDNNNE